MNIITIMALMSCGTALLMQAFFVKNDPNIRGPLGIRLDTTVRMAFCFFAIQAFACAIWMMGK